MTLASNKKKTNSKKSSKTDGQSKFQRKLLLVFAVSFLMLGALIKSTDLFQIGSKEFVSGTLLKVGFVLGLAWVAAPQLEMLGWQKLRGSMLVGAILVLILWSIRPRIGAIAGAVLLASMLLVAIIGWFRKASKLKS
ncbi:MAG: hypothetical protein AAF483_10980 [Planctomycetota bacterium]